MEEHPEKTQAALKEWRDTLKTQTNLALQSLARNNFYNTIIGIYFYTIAVILLAFVVYFIYSNGSKIVELVIGFIINRSSYVDFEPLLASIFFVVTLAIGMAIICVVFALVLQSRSNHEFKQALEGVSRLRREAEVGVSRSRALTQVLEETLANARQAFSLQLWISKTLFVVGLGLLVALVLYAIIWGNIDMLSASFGGGSVLSLIAATLTNPHRNIETYLSNVTQLEAILAGYTRQANILEEHIYQVMEYWRFKDDPTQAQDVIMKDIEKLSNVLEEAIKKIQTYVEPPEKPELNVNIGNQK